MLRLSFLVCLSVLIASFAVAQRVEQVDACSSMPCRDSEICIPLSRTSFQCISDIVPLGPEEPVSVPQTPVRVQQQRIVSTARVATPKLSSVVKTPTSLMTKPLAVVEPIEQFVAAPVPVTTPVVGRSQNLPKTAVQQPTAPRTTVPKAQQPSIMAPKLTNLVPAARTAAQSRKMELNNYCLGHSSGDQVPHPLDKRRFIFCKKNGDFVEMNCPGNLIYNTFLSRCDYTDKQPASPCASNPCQNGGECFELDAMRYRCDCIEGFSGEQCTRGIDACFSNPCGANGVCNVLPLKNVPYYCMCDSETRYGMDCETLAVNNPCMTDRSSTETYIASEISNQLFVHCEAESMFLKFCNEPLVWDQETSSCVWSSDQVASQFRF